MRILSRLLWFGGDGPPARAKAVEAIATLEPLGASIELARAYSALSQLCVLAQEIGPAELWGDRALELATRLGDEETRAHALVNLGTARIQVDPGALDGLLEAHAVADAAGDRHEATRALLNIGSTLLYWARPAEALRSIELALRVRAGARGAQPWLVPHDDALVAPPPGRRLGRGRADHAGRARAPDHSSSRRSSA